MNIHLLSLLSLVLLSLISACGMEMRQTQAVEGQASLEVRIAITFPECASIEDDWLLVECIKAASEVSVTINGALSEEEIAIIEELDAISNKEG